MSLYKWNAVLCVGQIAVAGLVWLVTHQLPIAVIAAMTPGLIMVLYATKQLDRVEPRWEAVALMYMGLLSLFTVVGLFCASLQLDPRLNEGTDLPLVLGGFAAFVACTGLFVGADEARKDGAPGPYLGLVAHLLPCGLGLVFGLPFRSAIRSR